MKKTAQTSAPIHELLAERWSPRAFEERAVEPAALASLFEAARWAPSCFNEQPWRFFVAERADQAAFERLAGCLVEGNAWARQAPLLVISATSGTFAHNGKPNPHAWHDVGLAAMSLVVQAQALGLSVHQMAGFDAARARTVLELPSGFEPVTMLAIGYRGPAESLPEKLAQRELAARTRRPLAATVFGDRWGKPLAGLG